MATPGGNGNTELSSEPLRRFYLDDICALKSNRSMVGTIDRTFYDIESHGSLAEHALIIAPVPVPEDKLSHFMISGMPPKGFVFVDWNERNQGCSLVSEDDVELIGRNLDIGNLVKRDQNDTMCGTVISVSPKYTLQPITYRVVDPRSGERGPVRFSRKRSNGLDGTRSQREDTTGPALLTNIDPDDLRISPDYAVGDFILYQEKVGVIRAVSRDIVVMLSNQTVVEVYDSSLIRMPLNVNHNNIVDARTDPPVAPWEWGQYIPNNSPIPGHLVHTCPMNLVRGRWIYGQFSGNHLEGNILATPITEVHVDWICSNVFAVGQSEIGSDDGILKRSDLQHAKIYDRLKVPRTAFEENRGHARSTLVAGDYVCFRDAAGAAVKYPQFDHIPLSETFGYDTNVFSILYATFDVIVQWQDSSVSTESSTSLHRLSGFEEEIMPGKIAALKDQTQVIPNLYFDSAEALYANLPPAMDESILRLNKVGVVQAVNSRERVALVRWFKEPNVELLHGGHVLRSSSVFGELEDKSSLVSVYEITSHPGLDRNISDMVMLAPEKVHESNLSSQPTEELSAFVGPCALSYLWPLSFWRVNHILSGIRNVWTQTEWFQRYIEIDRSPMSHFFSNSGSMTASENRPPLDWVGHIVGLNHDGTITVRLGALERCRDVRVPFEGILQVLDQEMGETDDDMDSELLGELYDDIGPGLFGGMGGAMERMLVMGLDHEDIFDRLGAILDPQGEDEWSTDYDEDSGSGNSFQDDYEAENNTSERNGIEGLVPHGDFGPSHEVIADHALDPPVIPPSEAANEPPPTDTISYRKFNQVVGEPSSFAILDTQPPADHHFLKSGLGDEGHSPLLLRRLAKEYKILAGSLPSGIFARTWESNMNLLRVLIIGPEGTPYEYAPYIIDFYFDSKFPHEPPTAFFHSWTNGMGRINPNLYEDGKICLSILGTWPSENPDETWSPTNSTVLQILVSLMGLVLVKDPFYNEAGFDRLAPEGDRRVESSQYTEKTFVMTRAFIKHALEEPMGDFADILAWHYLPGPEPSKRPNLLQKAISETQRMIDHYNTRQSDQKEESDGAPASPFVARLSLGAVVMLRKHLDALENIHKQNELEHDMDVLEL
ncbi:ubiquitin-conjugating enzyme E2 O [Talaromyces islandicus]|uniref:Ubiquitin-conjugating enzyme E2 O n=1 Tax=Talaromyces islandicus TaxID=28573 RepID=A0A0U1MAK5_TALIS|nr:ubiquitin-conjugating enzyme E2 O [Talaromyces islandicus]